MGSLPAPLPVPSGPWHAWPWEDGVLQVKGCILFVFPPCCLQGNWHIVGVLLANACYTDLYEKTYHFVSLSLVLHGLRTLPGPPPIGMGHIPQGGSG